MAAEVRQFTATIPAGTPKTAPVTVNLTMPTRIVRAVRWRVPPGPAGLMGFALAAAGVPIVPWNTGGWIVADNESDELPLEGQIDSGAWQLMGYNLGVKDHSVLLTFQLDLIGASASTAPLVPLTISP